ncbi:MULTISPECIES: N-acetylmuramoyl-L-alanine amidase [unclassified Coleofasciculus]|uniref:N-acetylmuramoyl-L-alanine amidase n=1 Tax=unclassified Coleofasciculus TaxID=2692782 RepID=UPI00187DE535|nr:MULTISPECIES: N-acetylmuramoyl-L-alanine amidase [unclassified Coleofasciculus]MBE9128541.1 N-acetylmuramoyl-L-alanine amidase [Coleofasciculus sp. LEGE 07081]MBE9151712.1 N-acetylmuramoyl-L-alanine amidase [Coleofasciculus sp. LEGE 07092]
MKYGIDIGHNCPPDTGARGIRKEDDMTLDVGTKVASKLKALGHQVVDCKPSRAWSVGNSLQQRCNSANANRVDRFVSIHFNAFNSKAKGIEVFAASNTGREIAKPVLDNLVELGYSNRGVKDGSHLYVLKNTAMPAILVECCFCDNQEDMDRYEAEALANAIVKGLTGQTPSTSKPEEQKSALDLQKALNRLKIRSPKGSPLPEDGSIDDETKAATKTFQAMVGVTPTGIGGPTTWQVIDQILAMPVLRENHASGSIVKYLQRRVGSEADGIFGPGTAAAVQRFQQQQGITVDGIVGAQSWAKLLA